MLMNRLRSDDGFSLMELMVVLLLMGIVIPVIVGVMYAAQSNLERDISRSVTNDQVRLAMKSLDREVRSGNVVYDPMTEVYAPGDVAAGMSFRIYTQSNAPSRGATAGDSGFRCVQWRITSPTSATPNELQRRMWIPGPNPAKPSWITVATGVRNRSPVPGDSVVSAFSQNTEGNRIDVNLRANADPKGGKGKTIESKVSVTGRNTILNWTAQKCGPPTPDPSQAGATGNRVPAY